MDAVKRNFPTENGLMKSFDQWFNQRVKRFSLPANEEEKEFVCARLQCFREIVREILSRIGPNTLTVDTLPDRFVIQDPHTGGGAGKEEGGIELTAFPLWIFDLMHLPYLRGVNTKGDLEEYIAQKSRRIQYYAAFFERRLKESMLPILKHVYREKIDQRVQEFLDKIPQEGVDPTVLQELLTERRREEERNLIEDLNAHEKVLHKCITYFFARNIDKKVVNGEKTGGFFESYLKVLSSLYYQNFSYADWGIDQLDHFVLLTAQTKAHSTLKCNT